MEYSAVGSAVSRQFDRVWDMLRDAISHFDDQQLHRSDIDWLVPARQAYHLIEAADCHLDKGPEPFVFGKLGGSWEESQAKDLPAREQLLGYLEQVQGKVRRWLQGHTDEQFLAVTSPGAWTGPTRLDRALYALRHAQHHVAHLNDELRRRNLSRGEWR